MTYPSPYMRLQALAHDPSFEKDVRLLSSQSDDLVVRVRAAFEQQVFLDHIGIRQCLEKIAELDHDTRSALTAALIHLPRLFRDITSLGGDFKTSLRGAIQSSESFVGSKPEDVEIFVEKLNFIAEPSAAQRLQWKAEWLATAVGFPLRSLDFVTELRPVFDDERSTIKGFVAVTTAVMTTNEGKEIAASVTEADLEELAIKIERAGSKLRAAKESIESQGYAVARTGREQAE